MVLMLSLEVLILVASKFFLFFFGLLLFVPFASAALDNAVVYFSFDNSTYSAPTLTDLSGAVQYDGTNDGATSGQVGKLVDSFSFVTNDKVTITYALNNQDYSVSFWAKWNDNTPSLKQCVVGGDTTDRVCVGISQTTGYPLFRRFDGTSDEIVGSTQVTVGVWYHYVATYNTTTDTMQLFINGASIGTVTSGDLSQAQTGTWIGGRNNSNFVDGNIDELGIWERILNSTEISELYNSGSGFNPYATPPSFFEITAEDVFDSSSLSNFSASFYREYIDTLGTNVWSDLSATDTGDWVGISVIRSVDVLDGKVYTGIDTGKFGVYDPNTNVWSDLSATDTGDWVGTSNIRSVAVFDGKVYTGLSSGKFGVYDPNTNVWSDLSATDTGDWVSSSGVNSIAFLDGKVYTGIDTGKFGVYDPNTNVWSDLSATDTGNWVGSGTVTSVAVFDGKVYTGISGGSFGVYDPNTNVWSDLSATDTGNWVSSTSVNTLTVFDGKVYTGLSSGKFGVYDPNTNVWSDLSATDTGDWVSSTSVNTLTVFDGKVYTGLSSGKFGVYSPYYQELIIDNYSLSTTNGTINTNISSSLGDLYNLTVSSNESGGYFNVSYLDYNTSSSLLAVLSQFRGSAFDAYTGNPLSTFSYWVRELCIGPCPSFPTGYTEFSTSSGLLRTNFNSPVDLTSTLYVSSPTYFNLSLGAFSLLNVSLNSSLVQSTAIFLADDVLGDNISDFNVTIGGTTLPSSATWNLSAGNYTALFSKDGWYSKNHSITVSALTNHQFILQDNYNHIALIRVQDLSLVGNTNIFDINITKSGYPSFSQFISVDANSSSVTTTLGSTQSTTSASFVTLWNPSIPSITYPVFVAGAFTHEFKTESTSSGTCEFKALYFYDDGTTGSSSVFTRTGASSGTVTLNNFDTTKILTGIEYQARRTAGSTTCRIGSGTMFLVREGPFAKAELIHGSYNITLDSPSWAITTTPVTLSSLQDYTYITIQAYTANSFLLTFYNETTNQLLNNATINIQFISTMQAFNTSTSNGSIYVDLLTPGDYTITYWRENLVRRNYYVELTPQSFNELRLYLIDQDDSAIYLPIARNSFSQACNNQTISLLRYYIDINGYRVVEMARTDVNGEAVLRVQPNIIDYKLFFSGDCGEFTTSPQKFTSTSNSFTIVGAQTVLTSSQALSNAVVSMNYINSTMTYVFDWSDSSNTVSRGCLIVYKSFAGRITTEHNQCLDMSSGSLIYTLNGTLNDTVWNAQGILHTNTPYSSYNFAGPTVSFLTSVARWGSAGVFFALLLILGVVLMNSTSASAIVFSSIGTLVVVMVLGIIAGGSGVIAGLIILGIIMLYKMRSN